MKRNPRVFFSFRSPFSWMAIERLHRALPTFSHAIEFIPYWEPDAITQEQLTQRNVSFHYTAMSKAKHLYILEDTKRLAAELGLSIKWPVDTAPAWELPHLAWISAERTGRGWEFYQAVTAARWLRGENICDRKVLASVAKTAGLSQDVVLGPESPDIRAQGLDCLIEAYEDDIFGVPYFRVGRHRFWGYDRADRFVSVLVSKAIVAGPGVPPEAAKTQRPDQPSLSYSQPARTSKQRLPAAVRSKIGLYDVDSAGGCG